MHRRYDGINIPIEIIRTLVTIADLGSYSKAGEKLGLSQPAISAQVKRAQVLVGGAIFDRRAPGGVVPTALGRLVLNHARTMLAANDQILSLCGSATESQLVRLGLCTMYAVDFMKIVAAEGWDDRLKMTCGNSLEIIARNLSDGYLDIACLADPPEGCGQIIAEWHEEFVWVRSREFVLSPGAPIPLVCWPGSVIDQPPIQALENARLAYRIAFTSADYHARMAAAAAGIGLMGMSKRHVGKSLVIAKEHYLPRLPSIRVVICVRPGVPMTKVDVVAKLLEKLAPAGLQLSAA
jgi:DNA-binding transcriptional LysR family regulator